MFNTEFKEFFKHILVRVNGQKKYFWLTVNMSKRAPNHLLIKVCLYKALNLPLPFMGLIQQIYVTILIIIVCTKRFSLIFKENFLSKSVTLQLRIN